MAETTIETAMVDILEAESDVTDLTSTRIYPADTVPDNTTKPYITYSRISTPRVNNLSGPDGMAEPRFQFNCIGSSYKSAVQVSNAVRGAFDGYSGTSDSVVIGNVMVEDEGDLADLSAGNEAQRTFGRRLDVFIQHQE